MKNFLIILCVSISSQISSQSFDMLQDLDCYMLNRKIPAEVSLDEIFNISFVLTDYNNTIPSYNTHNFSTGLNGMDILSFPDMERGGISKTYCPTKLLQSAIL